MERTLFALSLGLAGLILAPVPGHAEPQCATHQAVAEKLASQYGKKRHSMGLAANSTVMELYASLETGTWTMTVTMPNGMTCLVAAGDNFTTIQPALAPAT
jgi:hypothetical protein